MTRAERRRQELDAAAERERALTTHRCPDETPERWRWCARCLSEEAVRLSRHHPIVRGRSRTSMTTSITWLFHDKGAHST